MAPACSETVRAHRPRFETGGVEGVVFRKHEMGASHSRSCFFEGHLRGPQFLFN